VPEAWGYEAFSLLTEIAVATKRIKIATGIVNVFSRSPGLMAMHAATLDEISGGRLILGLGTSGVRVIEGFHGVKYKKPLTRLRQYVKVVQTLVAGEKLTDAGVDLWPELRPFKLEMKPIRPRIPIYCACLNDEAIRMIGELADGWMPTFWPYRRLGEGRKLLAEGAARTGRNVDDITIAPFTTVIPMPDKDFAYHSARSIISFYIGGMGDYYHAMLSRMGFKENADQVRDLYAAKRRDEAAGAVSQEMLDALVIAGEPDACRARLTEWRGAGVGLPILGLPTDMGPEICEMYLTMMAPAA
jgi:F420-dependent oxidoreductase-like protein